MFAPHSHPSPHPHSKILYIPFARTSYEYSFFICYTLLELSAWLNCSPHPPLKVGLNAFLSKLFLFMHKNLLSFQLLIHFVCLQILLFVFVFAFSFEGPCTSILHVLSD